MRFTPDSNILVRAVTSPGGPALRLPRYRITAGEAARFTGNLAEAAHLVEPVIVKPMTLSDPADDPALYTAADGAADLLCTQNTRHFSSSAVQVFCVEHGIRVMTDLEILRELFGGGGDPE